MGGSLIWHDTRLAGMADSRAADRVETVDGTTVLESAITSIGNYSNGRHGLDDISIMCHGYMQAHESASEGACVMIGGGGLQLCRDNLNRGNVRKMGGLNGFVSQITVYACGAADTHPDKVGTNWDGQSLFREMAQHTGAVVFAADVTQWYWRLRRAIPNTCTDIIDFRGWEGNLWRFAPDGSAPTVVESNPLTAR